MKETAGNKPTIGIIGGNGRFGSWFRGLFESDGFTVLVASRTTELTPEELASRADIVIVCVSLAETVSVIRKIRNHVREGALLCDFTSVKEAPLKEMLKAKPKCGVIGIHPLFGPLVPSFKGQTVVFCPGRNNAWILFLKEYFIEKGAHIVVTTAREHDRQMAVVQALTHFTNIVFAQTVQKQKRGVLHAYTTPVFRLQSILAGRILGGSGDLSTDLLMENPLFKKVLVDYERIFKTSVAHVKKKNKRAFVKAFNATAESMSSFISVAQKKAVELFSSLDRQVISLKQAPKITSLTGDTNIAYLGPEGTFSHKAVQNIFSQKHREIPNATISGIFEKVMRNEALLGVVPVENSIGGLIQETLDNIITYPLRIVGSYKMPICLCLLSRIKDKDAIRIIRSHPQPLSQAKDWLHNNFPEARLETESSSVKAILSTSDPQVAFIADKEAAQKYGLHILAENIQDKKYNVTEFYIISKSEAPQISRALRSEKTLLLLAVYDRPGVLRDILNKIAARGLNLSKLHSKASEIEGWNYYFFLEVEALPHDKNLKEALKEIKRYCSIVRVLGIT
ncbi:MAG: prephenate dehydrogenase/arogenate dehydrogenase family protein [Candidatus Azambacteria bacterium]|nr:prephenate dehydrogenase/arogenate dehydrogenase family protein [Candidatus Azambacteria bacterium]